VCLYSNKAPRWVCMMLCCISFHPPNHVQVIWTRECTFFFSTGLRFFPTHSFFFFSVFRFVSFPSNFAPLSYFCVLKSGIESKSSKRSPENPSSSVPALQPQGSLPRARLLLLLVDQSPISPPTAALRGTVKIFFYTPFYYPASQVPFRY